MTVPLSCSAESMEFLLIKSIKSSWMLECVDDFVMADSSSAYYRLAKVFPDGYVPDRRGRNPEEKRTVLIKNILEYGRINDDKVRLRADYSLDSEVVGSLNQEDLVFILEKSPVSEVIGDMEAHWYKVIRCSDNMTGWTNGNFVEELQGLKTSDYEAAAGFEN